MKKKIQFLIIFMFVTASFSMKYVDDKRSEESLNRAFADSSIIVRQEVKVTLASPIKKINTEKEENFEDIESLDFYNIKDEVVEVAASAVEESIDTLNHIDKEISSYKLPTVNLKKLKVETIKEELNNSLSLEEPVKVSRVISNKIESTKWAEVNIVIPQYKNEMIIAKSNDIIIKDVQKSDRISMALSSNERSAVDRNIEKTEVLPFAKKSEKSKVISQEDDLVFFDYSETKNEKSKKVEVAKVKLPAMKSTMTSQVQTKKKKINPIVKNQFDLEILNRLASNEANKKNENKPIIDDSSSKTMDKIVQNKNIIQDTSPDDYKKTHSSYILQAYRADNKEDLRNFDVRFNDDQDEILTDNGSGEISIDRVLTNTMGIRRTTILSKGNYPTVIDVVLEDSETSASVPVFSREFLGSMMTTQNLRGGDAFLLVELDTETEDVELDAKFEAKLFLDKNLKVVNRDDSDYNFIFFVGVEAGNTVVSFKTIKNEIVSKIIHLSTEEIYFDPNFYLDNKKDDFDLYEENLLSKSTSPLSLDVEEIEGLTFEAKIKKKTLNKYEISKVKYPLGTRSYIQLKHLNEPIFLGRFDNTISKVPSESYMRYILGQFAIDSVKSQCLVQVNLRKSAKEFYFNGQSKDLGMRVQAKVLDRDGIFYSDLSSESEKIFILGEEQGIINIQVKYTDGSFDFLQSYCSDSTYLVEQL